MQKTTSPATNPEHFINRELSWLAFNERVLEEALDATNPLAERLRFLLITETNLDEFFMVRVAGLKQRLFSRIETPYADGLSPTQILAAIRRSLVGYYERAYSLRDKILLPAFEVLGIRLEEVDGLTAKELTKVKRYFETEVFPILTPLAVDGGHPFPRLANRSVNMAIRLNRKTKASTPDYFAVVQIPSLLPSLFRLDEGSSQRRFVRVEDIIRLFIHRLFKGFEVIEAHPFRLTRDSDLVVEEDEGESLMKAVQLELRSRERGAAVRLEALDSIPLPLLAHLREALDLEEDDVYLLKSRLPLETLRPLLEEPLLAAESFRPFTPASPLLYEEPHEIFAQIAKNDILLHHPFDTFAVVEDLIAAAADDANVLGIKITLYRTGKKSRIVDSLIRAARSGKPVTAIVELRARFDEETNIHWAKRMEEEGVHVVYGLHGIKTHCKVALIVRKEGAQIIRYVHMGTGNYNSQTAKLYTDMSLLTIDKDIAEDASHLFNSLTGYSKLPPMRKLLIAPENLKRFILEHIATEEKNAASGKKGRIIAKMNSLVDGDVIQALYDASRAGVQIDLIVRGVCCLKPGLPGVSENIRVRSIVGRLLEHSRIFVFQNGGDTEVYLSSADWMPRNFLRRVEIAFPLIQGDLKKYVIDTVLNIYLTDTDSARILKNDGTYTRIDTAKKTGLNAQQKLIDSIRLSQEKTNPKQKMHSRKNRVKAKT